MSVWVKEEDWSKVKVGQRVRLEHENGDAVEVKVQGYLDDGLFASALYFYSMRAGWTLYVTPPSTPELPTEPGTVIAIGDWWLVRLRSYEGAPPAWEMLPLPSKESSERAKRNGAREQCVFGDEWVRAEVEQEGGFRVIAAPVPDTARQVLNRIDAVSIMVTGGRRMISLAAWDSLAAEFGVTEP